jgi:hypothetical protein
MHHSVNHWKTDLTKLTTHLGGVVVSVLATGPMGRGFKPGQRDEF